MTSLTLRDLAEDAYAYLPTQQSLRLLELDDHVLRVGSVNIPEGTMVLKVRSSEDGFPALLDQVRSWLRENDRAGAMWWIGPSATPPDLATRLEAEGMTPFEADPVFAGMIYEGEPPKVAGVDIRHVETPEDLELYLEVANRGWGVSDDVAERMTAAARANWPKRILGIDELWIACADGEPVGNAVSQYVGPAVYLGGSTVVPEARGHGVYRALVRRRWEDAYARGITAMIIQAGAMSRPIVERIGFAHVCDVTVYIDSISG